MTDWTAYNIVNFQIEMDDEWLSRFTRGRSYTHAQIYDALDREVRVWLEEVLKTTFPPELSLEVNYYIYLFSANFSRWCCVV